MSFSDHLRKLAQPIWDAQLTHPFVVAFGKGTLPERKFKILHPARRKISRRPRPCVFCRSAESAGFRIGPASDQARRRNHRRRTQPPRRVRITVEHERQADDVGADGADELCLHPAHAHRRPYRLGSGDHRRRPPLRLDLLRRRPASLEAWPAETRTSLSGLAHALRLAGIRRGAANGCGKKVDTSGPRRRAKKKSGGWKNRSSSARAMSGCFGRWRGTRRSGRCEGAGRDADTLHANTKAAAGFVTAVSFGASTCAVPCTARTALRTRRTTCLCRTAHRTAE